MSKGIIYYTDGRLDSLMREHMLQDLVRDTIRASGLPIVSCSLKPLEFGKNIVLDLQPGVITMYKQILAALEASEDEYVFYAEHDVLYHPTHFEFTPSQDHTFYYNTHVWRCHIRSDLCTTYDRLRSTSGLCCNRELAVDHYQRRIQYVYDQGFDKIPTTRNPEWARIMGYEPGKSPRNGGFSVDKIDDWRSEYPNIDVRHRLTMTAAKMHLEQFKHQPEGWRECNLAEVPGWNLRELFEL